MSTQALINTTTPMNSFEKCCSLKEERYFQISKIADPVIFIAATCAHGWLAYNYPIPIVCGITTKTVSVIITLALKKLNLIYSDKDTEYRQTIKEMPFYKISLLIPLIEEIFFRGVLQNSLSLIDKNLGLIISASTFGALHILNNHKNRYFQGIFQVGQGVVLGLLNNRFGILGSLASHSTNNFLAYLTLD